MDTWSNNRLTVLGPKAQLGRFLKGKWQQRLSARHGEWMENFPCRCVSIFETDEPPLESLQSLSRRWLRLTFLLDYEVEAERIKGLAKAKGGKLTHYRVTH